MIAKVKAIPEKAAFTIGLGLILFVPLFLFLMSLLFPVVEYWIEMIISLVAIFLSTFFVLSAADKRHSRIGKEK